MHLKTCSKCKNDLPITKFVLSPRYLDGHYPICKDCRKATRLLYLAKHTLCRNCHQESHVKGMPYCYRCSRMMKGRPIEPKFRRDPCNSSLCSCCKDKPRLPYHNYCQECKNSNWRKWDRKFGGWKNMTKEERQKSRARTYLNQAVRRGKIKKMPCEVCGEVKSEAHHYMGYDRKFWLIVQWLCKRHHDDAERILKSYLTKQPLLV